MYRGHKENGEETDHLWGDGQTSVHMYLGTAEAPSVGRIKVIVEFIVISG